MLGFHALGQVALGQISTTAAFAVVAAVGTFNVTGQSSALFPSASAGEFVVTGQNAALSVNMPADAGTFTLTGIGAGVSATRTVPLDCGSFTFTGLEMTPRVTMPADVGAFTFAGFIGSLVQGYVLNAEPYVSRQDVFVGFAALGQVAIGQGELPDGLTFQIQGQEMTFNVGMPADVGSYIVTGPSVIDFVRTIPKIRAFPRVGRSTISAHPIGRDAIKIRAYGG